MSDATLATGAEGGPEIRTLLLLELLGGGTLWEALPAESAGEVLARHDRVVRDLLPRFDGREIEKAGRFLLLFERPIDALRYGLAYHEAVAAVAAELGRPLAGRIGIHLGEVFLRENPPEHVRLGAKPLEVDGPARSEVARLLSLAVGGQTLLGEAAFDLAQRAAVGVEDFADGVVWRSHGSYRFAGTENVVEVFEVGAPGVAPLAAPDPPVSAEPRRATGVAPEGPAAWSPAAGEPIPHRPHWMLVRPLDEATYGDVWLGKHRKTGDLEAFRFCFDASELPRMQHQLAVVRHLRRELGERRIAPVTVDGQLEEAPYFLESEFGESSTLAAWARERGGLAEVPLATRLELAAELADLMAAVHSAGVVLDNLQPLTVLVRERSGAAMDVLIADLSRSRILDRELPADVRELLGSAETVPESAPYRAPELEDGASVTPQSDNYALGVLLYQLVAGDLTRVPGPFWHRDVRDELLREQIARLIDPDPRIRAADAAAVARNLRDLEARRAAPEAPDRDRPSDAEATARPPGLLRGLLGRRRAGKPS